MNKHASMAVMFKEKETVVDLPQLLMGLNIESRK